MSSRSWFSKGISGSDIPKWWQSALYGSIHVLTYPTYVCIHIVHMCVCTPYMHMGMYSMWVSSKEKCYLYSMYCKMHMSPTMTKQVRSLQTLEILQQLSQFCLALLHSHQSGVAGGLVGIHDVVLRLQLGPPRGEPLDLVHKGSDSGPNIPSHHFNLEKWQIEYAPPYIMCNNIFSHTYVCV